MVLRFIFFTLICPLIPSLGFACATYLANYIQNSPLHFVKYPRGTRLEVIYTLQFQPDFSYILKEHGLPEHLVHIHRINGEEVYFNWPRGARFLEGASANDTEFLLRMSFNIFEPLMHWDFFPPTEHTEVWQSVLSRLDEVIEIEIRKGSITSELGDFARTYHHGMNFKNISHVFMELPGQSWKTASIIHGGVGGGHFAGPYREALERQIGDTNKLQIEDTFPELRLPEREKYGNQAELFELVRLASSEGISALDQLAPALTRHILQKNGTLNVLADDTGVYFLAPTEVHQRHYEAFFRKRNIPLTKFAEPKKGFAVYRFLLLDFAEYYLNVGFVAQ